MSGLLFLLDVIAFVVVVLWTYGVDARGAADTRGLLGFKEPRPGEPRPARGRAAGWRGGAPPAGRGPRPPASAAATPAWKRTPLRSRPPPRV